MKFQAGLIHEGYKAFWGTNYGLNEELKKICGVEEIQLTCARRDFAAAQICIWPQEGGTLTIGGAPAFSAYGPRGGLRLSVEIDGFCPIMQHIGYVTDDDGVQRADILLQDETIELEEEKPHMVWLEIPISADTQPGNYEGVVRIYSHTMFEAEELVKEFRVRLTVKDVILPEKPSFYLDLWQHCSNIARKHEVALWSDAHFTILERYVATLGALGQRAVTVIASEIPWSGQTGFLTKNYISNLYEYSMIRVTRHKDGGFSYDWSAMQRYIDLCARYGIDDEIEVFGLCNIWVLEEMGFGACSDYPDGIRVRYFDESDGCYKFMDNKTDICAYIRALHDYFVVKGLIEKVRVAADEPADTGKHRIRIELLKENGPQFQYKTAVNHEEFIEEFQDDIFDIAPLLPFAAKHLEAVQSVRSRNNGRATWYVCCSPQFPNTFICSPLSECRLIGLLTWYLQLDGFLRWNYTVWPEYPRERISYRAGYWKAGDTNFVYPSRGGEVLLTLRYKILKRGIGDYELLRMANLSPDDGLWDGILKKKQIKDFYDEDIMGNPDRCYVRDYAAYDDFHNALLERIESNNRG